MLRTARFGQLLAGSVGLRCLEISVIGREPELIADIPVDRCLNPGAPAASGRVEHAGEGGVVDDFIVKALPISGERRSDFVAAIAQARFETTRALGLESGIANEIAGKEA